MKKEEKLSGNDHAGFDFICESEGITRPELEDFFDGLMAETERRIETYQPAPSRLATINRQLCAIAAVFLLAASVGLFVVQTKNLQQPPSESVYYGDHQLASGDKLLP